MEEKNKHKEPGISITRRARPQELLKDTGKVPVFLLHFPPSWSSLPWIAVFLESSVPGPCSGWFDRTASEKSQPGPTIATGATSREPPSVPTPRFVLVVPGSQHLLYATACSEAGTSLVAINLAAHSFSTRVLYSGLTNDEKSSSLGLCHPQSLRMRDCERPTFINCL